MSDLPLCDTHASRLPHLYPLSSKHPYSSNKPANPHAQLHCQEGQFRRMNPLAVIPSYSCLPPLLTWLCRGPCIEVRWTQRPCLLNIKRPLAPVEARIRSGW
ncbi:hypothetical protein BDV11DRAFT_78433 [Aspergillus similis]